MTKKVRIENADTSNHKVVIEVWEKHVDGDKCVSKFALLNPTDMNEQYIWGDGKWLVVREARPNEV